ncbi:hypothetical protein [Amycolatopsis sp. NPDC059657]|uniref:hypothetical protein n=1 Tax=Amycolatopsis sp. NPDC059657 TaxID=3346899 RepID=UPI0036705EAF
MTNPAPDAPEYPATQGYVYEQPAPPAPPKPKRTGVIVLSVLAVLLLGGATAFGVLYFKEKDRASSVSLELDAKKNELTAVAKRETDTKAELSKEQDLRNKAEEAQKKAESASTSNKACHEAANNLRAAAISQDEKKVEAAFEAVFLNC